MQPRYLLFIIVFLICSGNLYPQIVDDSTRLVYGPKSTRFVTENDVLDNTGKLHIIDTSLSDFHNIYSLYRGTSVFQTLGNFGTALQSIYYQPPSSIGKNFGFNSFDAYAFHPGKVNYYDTHSPYTSIFYIQGASGQQMIDAEFSRNIRPNWNFGFEFKRLTSQKLYGQRVTREQLANHTSFLFFTRFITRDSAYQVLANFTTLDHKNYETGGVFRDSGETNEDLFDYRREIVQLYGARSFEKRSAFHVYHQLSLPRKEFVQLYHIFDYYTQSNRFRASFDVDRFFLSGVTDTLLPYVFNPGATFDRTDFNLVENRGGIKGLLGPLYYRFNLRRKDFYYRQYYPPDSIIRFNENFVGAKFSLRISENSRVDGSTEYLLSANYLPNGERDYFIRGEFISNFLKTGFYRINHSPTLLQLRYRGNNLQWNHLNTPDSDFQNTLSDNLFATGNIKTKYFTFNPGINYSAIQNYIYFDTLASPSQDSLGRIQTFSADLLFKFRWRWFNLENFTRYTYVSRPEILKVPEIYNHFRMYFQEQLFKKALLLQIGVDVFWRSEYYADLYMPITQQFYLNNFAPIESYAIADLFINAQVKRTNAFVRFSHINEGFAGRGYFHTPFYPGIPRNFEFGIKWMFFD